MLKYLWIIELSELSCNFRLQVSCHVIYKWERGSFGKLSKFFSSLQTYFTFLSEHTESIYHPEGDDVSPLNLNSFHGKSKRFNEYQIFGLRNLNFVENSNNYSGKEMPCTCWYFDPNLIIICLDLGGLKVSVTPRPPAQPQHAQQMWEVQMSNTTQDKRCCLI